ncbi:t-SNARE syntaxin [Cyberlindnera jadinii NRRL Y-1542]|uniref:t-SNARE n=1 Tax=Cyberlindnera jadinii (strain ATCC 18201 / CBS 1600 / BCRC 20928 / JCM 3617 / NBRC 0987 / NRRL Y-1542) TaxID=983966 RepID=A0A1E4RWT8_CYBJN|nr:t-SNARE [Cyberlindnera jadinii NRRL Y-1542]ODV71752.1 t-SNARE [Cyberlindnera jadinii NRRL Y-1542]
MYAPHTPQNIQDRTLEFQQCVVSFNKRVSKQQQQQQQQQQQASQQQPQINKSQFQIRASEIAKDISRTSELLGKLALLAKKKPLFDDNPVEISELTYVIKQDIFKIEKSLKGLQEYLKSGGDMANSDMKKNSSNVVQLLNTRMRNVSGNFKEVLETRQKTELQNKSRKEKFFSSLQNSQLVQQTTADNPFLFDTGAHASANEALLSLPQDQQMQLLEEQGQEYLQDRNLAVETIESSINQVGQLFQQLATMVNEQSEQVQRIDSNVEDIDMNIVGAQRELLKYFNNISNNRWLYLKIFSVLLVFFILWIMVN